MKAMLRIIFAAALTTLLVTPAMAGGGSPYGFVLHMSAASYGGCTDPGTAPDDGTLTCNDVVDVGDDAGNPFGQFVWLLAFGWDNVDFESKSGNVTGWDSPMTIGGAQFGITWDPTVIVGGWTLCSGGSEIPESGWPAPNRGNAITWSGGAYNPGGTFATVGFFALSAGSTGRMTVQADPRILPDGEAILGSATGEEFVIPLSAAGSSVNVDGGTPDDGRKSCDEPVPTVQSTWGTIKSLYQ